MKTCIGCKYFNLSMAESGYGEYTPGSDFGMFCAKSQWTFDAYGTEQQFNFCITGASRCGLYELKPGFTVEQAKSS